MEIRLSDMHVQFVQQLFDRFPVLVSVVKEVDACSGQIFLVGGAVRDIFLGKDIKILDVDVEIHGLSLETVAKILRSYGPVDCVGKTFGVLRIMGIPIDWSLPRCDKEGRKPEVSIDKDLPIDVALRRRDLTMNAMAIDLKKLILHDPFHGLADIKARILRTPDPSFFIQDPLRLYRVMQFIARYEMSPDENLTSICRTMDITGVSRERIEMEFAKLLLKSQYPSKGFRWLHALGRLAEILPELDALATVMQDPSWHPEGNAFEHTMQVLDAASLLSYHDEQQRLVMLYAALCHDLGKAVATREIEGRLRSIGHDIEGVKLTRSMLARLTHTARLCKAVEKLVRHHMVPGMLMKSHASSAAYKRLAYELSPDVNLYMLAQLACADRRGRNSEGAVPLDVSDREIDQFIETAREIGVLYAPEAHILQAQDLLDVISPGPQLGCALQRAYKIQINKGITDKVELRRRVLSGGDIKTAS